MSPTLVLPRAGTVSLFSATLFPSSPHCDAPPGRKVPKLMFSRKVRAAVRPGRPPGGAVEGPGAGSEQGAFGITACAQPRTTSTPTCELPCPSSRPARGSAHPEGRAAWFGPGCAPPGLGRRGWATGAGVSSVPVGPAPSPPPPLGAARAVMQGTPCPPRKGSRPALGTELGI